MSNENVIKKFLKKEDAKTPLRNIVNGCYIYKGRTLWTKGNELINNLFINRKMISIIRQICDIV